ncbi:maltose/maltodextrin ABC transporter, substrate binding periplasmic protein MalE [Lachnospiraceae bacterium KM106-2]|nr:maltose/maltodextrin ABC transporter, substrate binding periplasmic protein MalE [Lachnospiraceae bacterium KM106-2]
MKRFISFLLCLLMITSLLAGCGTKKTTTKSGKTDTKGKAEPVTITVWHDGDEAIMKTIETKLNDSLKKDQITVKFEKKTGLSDQLKLYGNDASNGPDMYFYAHDSLGTFVEMGVLAKITDVVGEDTMKDLIPMTVDACKYKNDQYLLPIYFETLLFMYNKDLWKGEVPSTTDELYDYMVKNTDTKASKYAVVNQHSTAYNVAPVINGFGASVLDEKNQPALNSQEMIDAVTYNNKFAKLQADGDYNTVSTLFNEKKAAAIVGGPWLVSGIKKAGINVAYKSLSDFKLPNGNPLAPYSGVQGIGIMKHSVEEKKDALKKVLEVLAKPEVGVELVKTCNCAPANTKSYDDPEVAKNEMVEAIKKTADTAKPMPNVPQISVMWTPTEAMLAAINKSNVKDIKKAADKAQKDAESAVADMK